MSEPKNDSEQLLDDLNADEACAGVSILMAWTIGICCMLFGFIAGKITL